MSMQVVINYLLIDLRKMLSHQRSYKKLLKLTTMDLNRKSINETIEYLHGGIDSTIFSLSLIRPHHGKLYLKKEFSHKYKMPMPEIEFNETN